MVLLSSYCDMFEPCVKAVNLYVKFREDDSLRALALRALVRELSGDREAADARAHSCGAGARELP